MTSATIWCHNCGSTHHVTARDHPELKCQRCGTLLAIANMVGGPRGGNAPAFSLGVQQLTCSACGKALWHEVPIISSEPVACACGGRLRWGEGRFTPA